MAQVALYVLMLFTLCVQTAWGGEERPAPPRILHQEVPPDDPGSLIKRFVDPLMRTSTAGNDFGLDSDREHADSAALVVTPETPVYVRAGSGGPRRPLGDNFILLNGRVFMNYDSPQDPDKLPRLCIRPIDDGTRIPWLARIVLTPRSSISWDSGSVEVSIDAPSIFLPELSVTGVILEGRKIPFRMRRLMGNGSFEVSVSLHPADLGWTQGGVNNPATLFIAGEVHLMQYDAINARSFPNLAEMKVPESLSGLSKLVRGRDYANDVEKEQIEALARGIIGPERNVMTIVRRIDLHVATTLRYFRNSMLRSPMQVVAEGLGDCDDFTRLVIALLRSLGIPCSAAVGAIYDFNNYGAHAWVEVGVPDKNGRVYWFLCDPTLASAANDKDYFVRLKNRIYLYPMGVKVRVLNMPAGYSTDVLLNWTDESLKQETALQAWKTMITTFCTDLETSMLQEVDAFARLAANLAPRREFRFTPASDYILVDQPPEAMLVDYRALKDPDLVYKMKTVLQKTKDHARWQIRVNPASDLVLELGVLDDDFDLEGTDDQKVIVMIQGLYKALKDELLSGKELRHCLEMTYTRDRHTDRLQRVDIRIGRYLAEKNFGQILKMLQNARLVLPEDSAKLGQFYEICHGKNFYFLLEAANRAK